MSRIGNRQLTIPTGVTIENNDSKVTVKGSKGSLELDIPKEINVAINEGIVVVTRINETKKAKQLHGTINALISNMLIGVSEGYKKELEIIGVGYRFNVSGKKITVNAGYSHPVELEVPEGLTVEAPSNTELNVSGIDKCLVGEFSAVVRKVRPPEPYKGKGIRYKNEQIRRKEGKKAS